MTITRRKFTLEFRTETAHLVIDTARSVRAVASELSIEENTLSKRVRDESRRMEALKGTSEEPLSAAERAKLRRLRREMSKLQKDHDFLKKLPRTSLRIHQSREICADGRGVRELRGRNCCRLS
jgi:transposase